MWEALSGFLGLVFELALYITYYAMLIGQRVGITTTQGAAEMLPEVVQLAIGALVTYLVVNGLKEVSEWTGRDLSGNTAVIAVAVTGIVVFTVNTILSTVLQ